MKNICNTFTLISILMSAPTISAIGQDIERSPPKWELGVDLYSLFKPAEEQLFRSTYGLMLRRQVNKDHALRFRTNFGISLVPNPTVKGTNQPRNYNLSFDLGREKQRKFGKFIHYYGADLQFKYINTNTTTGFGVNGVPATFTQSKGHVIGGGISAFMGGKYLLTERIGLSIETNAMISYIKIHGTYQDIDINGQPLTKSGLVRGYYIAENDHRSSTEVTEWFARENNFFNSTKSFVYQIPSNESIEVLEPTELIYINRSDLYELYARYPEVNNLGRLIAERYWIMYKDKVRDLRFHSAQERMEHFYAQSRDLFNRIPQKHIASYLGISENYVSKIKAKH